MGICIWIRVYFSFMKFYLGGPLCVTEVECENKVDTNAHDCVQPQELVYITKVLLSGTQQK